MPSLHLLLRCSLSRGRGERRDTNLRHSCPTNESFKAAAKGRIPPTPLVYYNQILSEEELKKISVLLFFDSLMLGVLENLVWLMARPELWLQGSCALRGDGYFVWFTAEFPWFFVTNKNQAARWCFFCEKLATRNEKPQPWRGSGGGNAQQCRNKIGDVRWIIDDDQLAGSVSCAITARNTGQENRFHYHPQCWITHIHTHAHLVKDNTIKCPSLPLFEV